jgi:hypothetical protein
MDDESFAIWLDGRSRANEEVVVAHGDFLWKVYTRVGAEAELTPVDADSKSKRKLKVLASNGLLKTLPLQREQLAAARRPSPDWHPQPVTADVIETMVTSRLTVLGRAGRGTPISDGTAFRVWADAAARCMFAGCGEDLSRIPLHTKTAKIGYLAHIVASDPRGPRGNELESHPLADAPDNIMLMCDAHHRLIDSFAADDYKAPRLREMRADHVSFVRRHLEALALPKVQGLTLLADLGNVAMNFNEADATEAVLAMRGNLLPGILHHVRYVARDDRSAPGFWANYLHQLELHISRLVTAFRGESEHAGSELAIFPVHHTPTMVLAGRIVGEAQRITVYQYDRHRKTWQWDSAATKHAPGTFTSELPPQSEGCEDLLLTVELTATLAPDAIPLSIAEQVAAKAVPWVRLSIANPNNGCIQHPDDLKQFVQAARDIVAKIHDSIRPRRVHLIVMAPASSVFSFGQLLQAGHHPVYTLYDRSSGQDRFIEAFSIDGHMVHPPAGSTQKPLQIR